jgi:YHS domain-containing protein
MMAMASQEGFMSDCFRRSILVGLPILVLAAAGRVPQAAEAAPATGKRLALGGYDPVSYFIDGHPEKGSADYQASYDDATYWFKTPEHRATFVADPDHYAPQFQGYCTVTLVRGTKYEADPEAWVIADGKLYVFGTKEAVPTFRAHTASIVGKATENWAKLRATP